MWLLTCVSSTSLEEGSGWLHNACASQLLACFRRADHRYQLLPGLPQDAALKMMPPCVRTHIKRMVQGRKNPLLCLFSQHGILRGPQETTRPTLKSSILLVDRVLLFWCLWGWSTSSRQIAMSFVGCW